MNKDAKIFLIALSITSIILLYTSIVFFVMKEGEKDKKAAFQKQLGEVSIAKQDLEARLKEIELANAEMKGNIRSQDDKIGSLTQQLAEEKAVNAKTAAKLQEKEAEIQSLKSKLAEEKAEKEELSRRLDKLNEDYLNMKFQLENLLKTKEEMDRRARELSDKEGVSLGTIVIKQPK